MAFWNAAGPEPKRQFRWYMLFGGTAGSDLTDIRYALKKTDKPKYKIGEITHKYLNHSFYYPGRLEWEAINVTFASVSDPDATNLIDVLTYNSGYRVPTSAEAVETISKQKFGEALAANGISLIQIDSNGNKIEEWLLKNPFFTNVNYGSLDYGSDEIVEISCTIRYDWAQNIVVSDPDDSNDGSDATVKAAESI
jgi:hypothetical protein